jgi:hypothetical protein
MATDADAAGSTLTMWVVVLSLIARVCLLVLPLVYILGADNWTVLIWFIFYAVLFGLDWLYKFIIMVYSIAKTKTGIFPNIHSFRRFCSLFIFSTVDYGSNLFIWCFWLVGHNPYVDSPNHSNTPDVNSDGYYSFQSMCGAFFFGSVIYIIFAFQFLGTVWVENAPFTPSEETTSLRAGGVSTSASNPASGSRQRTRSRERAAPSVVPDPVLGGKGVSLSKGIVKAFVATGAIYIIVLFVLLAAYFYHLFRAKTDFTYSAVTGLLYSSLAFWIAHIGIYYISGGSSAPSIRQMVLAPATDKASHEAGMHLNEEMRSYFLSGFFIFFFNVVFTVYAFSLSGANEMKWDTVPQFDSSVANQSSFFYLWVTTAAINTGALCFLAYNIVTLGFIVYRAPDDEDEDDRGKSAVADGEQAVSATTVVELIPNWSIVALLFALTAMWIVFYAFIIEAIVGGHWFAEFIFPVTISFAVVFFVGALAVIVISYLRYRGVMQTDGKTQSINQMYTLSTVRNSVVIPVAYVLIVIILSVLIYEYFENKTHSNWTCIRPTPSTATPPFNSCNVYWGAGVLALYCVHQVYLVCIVNAMSTMSMRIHVRRTNAAIK